MPGTADRIRGNRLLAALVFALTLGLSVWGVMVARTFLRAPGQADGAVTRTGPAPENAMAAKESGAHASGSPAPGAQGAPKRDAAAVDAVLEGARALSAQPAKAEVVLS